MTSEAAGTRMTSRAMMTWAYEETDHVEDALAVAEFEMAVVALCLADLWKHGRFYIESWLMLRWPRGISPRWTPWVTLL